MSRDVNPYEPWRPRPADRPVPKVEVRRPWRPRAEPAAPVPPPPKVEPILEVEPVPPQPPRPVPPRRPAVKQNPARIPADGVEGASTLMRRPAAEQDPARLPILGMVLFLLAVGIVALAVQGGEHCPRVFLGCLALGLGWGANLVLYHRGRPRSVRLACVVGGVLAALAVRWFVPTVDGVSLWEAGQVAAQTEEIPAGDIAQFTAGAYHRKAAMKRFPEYAAEISAAERAWLRRSTSAAVEAAGSAIDRDPARASADLRVLAQAIGRLDRGAEAREELRGVRREAVLARARTLAAGLEGLVARDECEAVADVAARGLTELADEAREVDAYREVANALAAARARALSARLDAAVAKLDAALSRGEFTAVARGGKKAEADLSVEARDLGQEKPVHDRLVAVRRKAVLAALDAGRREVEALREKGRFGAIASLGEQLGRVLADEAQEAGAGAELDQFRRECRALGAPAGKGGR